MENTPAGGGSALGDGESPAEHVDRLLAETGGLRLDPFLLTRLRSAVAHWTELQAVRGGRSGERSLRCRLFKHSYLLADGESEVLWELEHNTASDGRTQHEVYVDPGALAEAEQRICRWSGGVQIIPGSGDEGGFEPLGENGPEDPFPLPGWGPGSGWTHRVDHSQGAPAPFGSFHFDCEYAAEPGSGLDWDIDLDGGFPGSLVKEGKEGPDTASGHGESVAPFAPSSGQVPSADGRDAVGGGPFNERIAFTIKAPPAFRTYTQGHSAEHARRVLRRSENEDRPGEEARLLLCSALAHDTTFVSRWRARVGGRVVEWSLFEHAFLLAGGRELSLWELEHDAAPDGRLVCEVYLGEDAARDSVDRGYHQE